MYTALDIANWFIAYNNAEFRLNETVEYNVYERLLYSKLQMLLYLAQGVYMNYNKGKLLFADDIYAEKYGVTIKSVREKYAKYGSKPIVKKFTSAEFVVIEEIELDASIIECLITTYEEYNIYTPLGLKNICCGKHSPWYKAVNTTDRIIPVKKVRKHIANMYK